MLVGIVTWDHQNQYAHFEYDPKFINTSLELSPLKMPLTSEIYTFANLAKPTFKGLPGLLADHLPDDFGNKIIDSWLARQGRDLASFSPIERLCYIGKRSMGALEFVPAIIDPATKSIPIEIKELVTLANQVLHNRENIQANITADDFSKIITVGTSAGGQRPKAVIAIDPKTNQVRSGQVPAPDGYEHWLLKFDGITAGNSEDPAGYGKIEYVYYQLARSAGIEISECRILEENGRSHFMTKRFDRITNNNKIHLQSLCGMAHYDYQDAGAYSYEQVFSIMRKLKLSHHATEQLYRRMIFNIIARNQDDHTKNISFMMDPHGTWDLAPAYDLTFSYNPQGIWTNTHQMSSNGKRDNFVMEDLLAVARQANINITTAKIIIEQIINAIATWPELAKTIAITPDIIKYIGSTHRLGIK